MTAEGNAMEGRTARRLALGLVALTVALMVSGQALAIAADTERLDVLIWAFAVVFSLVGTLVATRHPGNAIGWIFLSVGVAAGLGALTGGYADYWVGGHGGSKALGEAAAAYASSSWIAFVLVPATFLLLLFPDGRLLSPRWRWVAWSASAGIAGAFVSGILTPGPLEDYPEIVNPFGVSSSALDLFTGLMFLLLLVGVPGSAASLIVRYRRAAGEQRQQIKWLALAGGLVAVAVPIGTLGYDVWGETVSNVMIMLSVLGLPVAAGVAILRYRLYDIDVVINRALVYGALTATLAGAYLASVLVLQLALSGLTEDSGLAVAGSTLAVAALFRPARTRIQEAVDRRFFRRRYDAARTLESFSARLRDQVDLAALDAELRGVVAETMQPAHVSLWLRGPPASGG
jgi:hypothetical protein